MKKAKLKEVKRFSKGYELSYNKAKSRAEREGYRFIRKEEYGHIKRGEAEKVKVQRLKRELAIIEREEEREEERPSFIGVHSYILIASIGDTHEGTLKGFLEYRIKIDSKEPIDNAEGLLIEEFYDAHRRYPVMSANQYSLNFQETTTVDMFLGDERKTREFLRYDINRRLTSRPRRI